MKTSPKPAVPSSPWKKALLTTLVVVVPGGALLGLAWLLAGRHYKARGRKEAAAPVGGDEG